MTEVVQGRSAVTFILLFFVSLAIIGIVAGAYVVRDYAKGRASLSWPTTEAVILSDRDGDGFHYAYSFVGRSYQSSRRSVFSARFKSREEKAFQPGDSVTVYVNPAAPSYSVIYPGGVGLVFSIFSILCGLCIFIGVGGVVWTFSDGVDELTDGALA